MNKCKKIISLLPLYLTQDLSPSEMSLVTEHLEKCLKCAKELATYQEIKKSLATLKEEFIPLEFWQRYTDEVLQKVKSKKSAPIFISIRPVLFRWVSRVAVFLIGLIMGYTIIYLAHTKKPLKEIQPPSLVETTSTTPVVTNHLLGVKLQPVNQAIQLHWGLSTKQGIIVIECLKDSIAHKLDIKPYDIIIEINEKPVNIESFQEILQQVDNTPTFTIIRGGQPIKIKYMKNLESK